jgi:hypothetical protein
MTTPWSAVMVRLSVSVEVDGEPGAPGDVDRRQVDEAHLAEFAGAGHRHLRLVGERVEQP